MCSSHFPPSTASETPSGKQRKRDRKQRVAKTPRSVAKQFLSTGAQLNPTHPTGTDIMLMTDRPNRVLQWCFPSAHLRVSERRALLVRHEDHSLQCVFFSFSRPFPISPSGREASRSRGKLGQQTWKFLRTGAFQLDGERAVQKLINYLCALNRRANTPTPLGTVGTAGGMTDGYRYQSVHRRLWITGSLVYRK